MKLSNQKFASEWEVRVPSFRQDLGLEVDLIEEIARVFGFRHLVSQTPITGLVFNPIPETMIPVSRFKEVLVNRGYFETLNYSFIAASLAELFLPDSNPLGLTNPISTEMAVMRETLWPGLIKALEYNQRRQQTRVRFFEVGLCFSNQGGALVQQVKLGGICGGPFYKEQWGLANRMHDYYDVKQDVEVLMALSKENEHIQFEQEEHHQSLHPGQAAKMLKAGEVIGYVGAIHPRILKKLDIEGPVFVFELNLEKLTQATIPVFRDFSKYPAIRRDLAIIVEEGVFASALKSAIVNCAGSLLREVFLFDVYQGKGIEPGKKSIALGLILQHPSRTLVESEVNDTIKNIVAVLSDQFQAILRE